jgi:hypothetical protein
MLFFTENLYLGLAAVTLMAVYGFTYWTPQDQPVSNIFNNLGKLLLSFSLLWVYLLGSQYLTIWYGNLPREISFMLARSSSAGWRALTLASVLLAFALPFLMLLSRIARESPKILATAAISALAGLWLARFLLVAPALSPGPRISVAWEEFLITAGFFASFCGTYILAVRRFRTASTAE